MLFLPSHNHSVNPLSIKSYIERLKNEYPMILNEKLNSFRFSGLRKYDLVFG